MSKPGPAWRDGRRDLRASDLAHVLEQQIRAGEYAEGARLPTVRALAAQYQVNKNTVARAYQSLARRGLIVLSRGRGAFVRASSDGDGLPLQQRVHQLVTDARRGGVSRSQLLDSVVATVEQVYGVAPPRLLFVECNPQDLATLGGELSQVVGLPLEQLLLEAALRAAGNLADRYDLVITTFQHLGQLRQALPAAASRQIVGVLATPSHDSLLELARLHVATFGLICDTPSTIEHLTHIIYTYNPGATVLPALIDDEAQVRAVVQRADAIVVTRSCHARLAALALPQPIVTVVFTIDQQSIDFLRRRLHELRKPAAVAGDP